MSVAPAVGEAVLTVGYEDALGSELHDVYVQARREPRVPIDGEALVSSRPESVAKTLRAAE